MAYQDSSIKQSAFSNCYKTIESIIRCSILCRHSKVRYEEAVALIPRWKPNLELQARIDMANDNGDMFKEIG